MTNRYAHEHPAEAKAAMAGLISPAPEGYIEAQYETIWGDKSGSFAEKFGPDADAEIDWRAVQRDLTAEL